MKISLNWLKDYLELDAHSPETVGDILTSIGLEVEGIETVESIPGGLHGVVVGEVVECVQHPNADRLSLTKVNVGVDDLLSIVCGAPNVEQGQRVLVATKGTELYPNGSSEPLKIKKGKIRGEISEGMICAEDELGVGESHDGIMVLPPDTPIGQPARDYFQLETDTVYEIGLTPNRSDATNHLGVAKDLFAALKINHGYRSNLQVPHVDGIQVTNPNLPIEVVVEHTEACPRYAGLCIDEIKVGPSPEWMQRRLKAIGVRPINNIVDITNFVLHELGQPLHAFDYDKIEGKKIIVDTLEEGTPFKTLDETERTLSAYDLMICDGNRNGLCIGGVFGGIGTGVTNSTTRIFLESAHFNPKYVRRTSMAHNLRTDAAKVFEKGSDPNIVVYALERAARLIEELSGGRAASAIVDIYPAPIERVRVAVRYQRVNQLIGVNLQAREVRAILEAMEMDVLSQDEEGFVVAVPTNKTDVTREVDVIEEILRIYGFNKVPMSGRINAALNIAPKPDPNRVRDAVASYLTANGLHEIMALSLSESRYYRELAPELGLEDELVYINNTSNVHLDIMRPTILFGGLEAIVHNQNRQQADVKLFEFGRSYRNREGTIAEGQHLAIFLTGKRHPESWLTSNQTAAGYFTLKALVKNTLSRCGVEDFQQSALEHPAYSYGSRYHRGPKALVVFGRVAGTIAQQMGIRSEVYFADFNWDAIMVATGKQNVQVTPINKYPTVRRDLALVIEKNVNFSDIVAIGRKVGKKLITDINLFDVYENAEQLGENKKSYAVSFLFEDANQTLRDKQVDKVIDQLIEAYEKQLGAFIRQ